MVHLVDAALAGRAVMRARRLDALALFAKPSPRLVEPLRVVLRGVDIVFGGGVTLHRAWVSGGGPVVGSADQSDQDLEADDVEESRPVSSEPRPQHLGRQGVVDVEDRRPPEKVASEPARVGEDEPTGHTKVLPLRRRLLRL